MEFIFLFKIIFALLAFWTILIMMLMLAKSFTRQVAHESQRQRLSPVSVELSGWESLTPLDVDEALELL